MGKVRVYEYAKQMNMNSKEVLTILERMNLPVKNHMSIIDEEMVGKVEEFFKNVKKTSVDTKPSGVSKELQQGVNMDEKGSGTLGTVSPSVAASSNKIEGEKNNEGVATRASSYHKPNKPSSSSQGEQNKLKEQNKAQGQSNQSRPKPVASISNSNDASKGKRQEDPKKSKPAFHSKPKEGSSKGFSGQNSRPHHHGGKRKPSRVSMQKAVIAPVLPKEIEVAGPLQVGEFSKRIRKEASEVMKKLILMGVMVTINQEIDVDTMTLIAGEYGIGVVYKELVDESYFENQEERDSLEDMKERPPVVTIMGHVDHGKTTLLDRIRKTNVTEGEAGGITQHIGAYQVEISNKKITFLDTPGHAAFTTMRARGAQVTDITILVVAADDGVMPQTIEAINHAKAAEVPIIVALNKMDKPDADVDRIKQQLTEYGLVSEEWGGDTVFVPVSAKNGTGIDDLLEMILLVAEVQEYKANPDKRARGIVIEAELDKGRGPVATILVQNGTLKIGDGIVAGSFFGKIRAMINDKGRRIKEAPPSTPVSILGLSDVPGAGDPFMVFEYEKKGRSIADRRAIKQREEDRNPGNRITLDDLFKQIQEGAVKELNVIIKSDVQGSAEAMKSSLEKIEIEGVRVKIIHSGVGAITESDIILSSASNAIIVGFNVRVEPKTRALAEQEKVDIRLHRVIYNAIAEIEAAMTGLLDPEYQEKEIGMLEARQVFKVSKIGTIAGCYVTEGKVVRDSKIRLIRDGIVVHEGKIDTLKRFKDDVKEVSQGYECGVTIEGYNDIKEGDMIEAYVIEEVKRA